MSLQEAIIPLPRLPGTRRRDSKAPWYVRSAVNALASVDVEEAAALAMHIFLKPPRYAPPASERDARSEAVKRWLDTPGGRIRTYEWGGGPVLPWENRRRGRPVLLVHGWGGRGTQLGGFRTALRDAGHDVVAIDAPGHGEAPGRKFDLLRFVEVLRAVGERYGTLEAVIGHSMGAIASLAAIAQGLRAHKAVLVGGPSNIRYAITSFSEQMGLTPEVTAQFDIKLARRFGEATLGQFDIEAMAAQLARQKALVVHDLDDVDVGFEEGQRLVSLLPGAELVPTAGLGHRRILSDPMVVNAVTRFVVGSARAARPTTPCFA